MGESRYINLSDRCTLRCQFCPKTHDELRVHDHDLRLSHRPTAEDIIEALGNPAQYSEIVFCGFGESTLRLKELVKIARFVKTHGGRVRVNTDGLANLVNKRNVLPELADSVDALCISMNAQNEEIYNRHCQPSISGSYQAMLAFLKLAPHYIDDVTATAINGLEGVDIDACEKLASERGVKFRRRELDVVG
ncbi:MAG: radical SAM protein [Gammaproteobacteria bacterium]|nr:MAG: radical SAM protein [Gammaproteobacteria bacterium]